MIGRRFAFFFEFVCVVETEKFWKKREAHALFNRNLLLSCCDF